MAVPHSFSVWLRANNHVPDGKLWVVARRTARMVERYGEKTVFFSPKRHAELVEEHRVALREDLLFNLSLEYGVFNIDALRAAFEAGRKAR